MADAKKLGDNIRIIRNSYGESQLDLAFAIGKDAPNVISNYETGRQMPERDLLHKIAYHYMLTVDELINGDFSEFNMSSLYSNNIEYLNQVFVKTLPIIHTEAALTNPLFKKAYEAHMRVYNDIMDGKEPSEDDFLTCFGLYIDAYEQNDTPEAAANCLWWLIVIGLSITIKDRTAEGYSRLEKKQISAKEFLRDFFLPIPDEGFIDEEELECKKELQAYRDSLGKDITRLLRSLKALPEWSDLAYYYTALRYIVGLATSNTSIEMSRAIGIEMMWAFARLGNKYARKFASLIHQVRKKDENK